jgi:hypothetical protein
MITTFSESVFAAQSSGFSSRAVSLLEPAMTVATALFWCIALPFVAFSLMCVKVWDTIVGFFPGAGVGSNKLILRTGPVNTRPVAHRSDRTATI